MMSTLAVSHVRLRRAFRFESRTAEPQARRDTEFNS